MEEYGGKDEAGASQTMMNFKDFPLSQFNYGRPSFINFIDHLIKSGEGDVSTDNNKKIKFNPPFPEWLFSTCRAILDSKYFEYILYEDLGFANVSRLNDFVYSWLG